MDENCADYISHSAEFSGVLSQTPLNASQTKTDASSLSDAVVKGMKNAAAECAKKMLADGTKPLEIVQNEIIPALDTVGKGFENKTIYLPQLLMSAEAAKEAFEVIKANMSDKNREGSAKCRVVIATVKGDIHDIGKNIVKLLLENYGFAVSDLGKDVPAELIIDTAVEKNIKVILLSALMTTTMGNMKEVVDLAVSRGLNGLKFIVGGAVVDEEFAKSIGATYGNTPMDSVRAAQKLSGVTD